MTIKVRLILPLFPYFTDYDTGFVGDAIIISEPLLPPKLVSNMVIYHWYSTAGYE